MAILFFHKIMLFCSDCIELRLYTIIKPLASFPLCGTLMISIIVVVIFSSREFLTIEIIPIISISNQSISSSIRVSSFTKCVHSRTLSDTKCRLLDISCVTFSVACISIHFKVFDPFGVRQYTLLNPCQTSPLRSSKLPHSQFIYDKVNRFILSPLNDSPSYQS